MSTCGGSFLVQERLSLADVVIWATLYGLLAPESTASNGKGWRERERGGGGGRRERESPFVYVFFVYSRACVERERWVCVHVLVSTEILMEC